jgi:hypothetical protein
MADQLDTLDRLRELVAENHETFRERQVIEADSLHCPKCAGQRRMKVREMMRKGVDYSPRRKASNALGDHPALSMGAPYNPKETPEQRFLRQLRDEGMAPAVYLYECNQCRTGFTALVYDGPAGESLAVFPSLGGGITKPNTPTSVAYYLDQAARSRAADARSAAVAMYRSALEHVLEDQGFKVRMCGPKIAALEAAIESKTAPKWAIDVDPDVMRFLSQLGNGVLHTNGGDITLQENATPELLEHILLTMSELLDAVYERPAAAAARKLALSESATKMKR